MNRHRLPAHLVPAYAPAELREGAARLAAELDPWAARTRAETGRPLLAICVLRGGVFFFSDLLQAMSESVEPAFCRCHAYRKGVNGDAAAELTVEFFPEGVTDRSVLLVDNICDSGRTLAKLAQLCVAQGARELRTAVLIHRQRDDAMFAPDHAAFVHAGAEWLAGYGLRDGDAAMNFPAVFSVRPGSTPAS